MKRATRVFGAGAAFIDCVIRKSRCNLTADLRSGVGVWLILVVIVNLKLVEERRVVDAEIVRGFPTTTNLLYRTDPSSLR